MSEGSTRKNVEIARRVRDDMTAKRIGRSSGLKKVMVDEEMAETTMPAASRSRMSSCTTCAGDEKKAPNMKILEMAHAWKQAAKKRKASTLSGDGGGDDAADAGQE